MVVIRFLPKLFGDREEAVFGALRGDVPRAAARTSSAATSSGSSTAPIRGADAAIAYAHIGPTGRRAPCGTPLLFVPELFTRAQGIRATRMVADALGDEVL